MKNYYIADTHFGHKAVLQYDHRPFCDVEQMEEGMTMLWNAAVYKDDMVYILGDFCWQNDADEWMRLLRRLKGQKVLVQGNHDRKSYPDELRAMFVDITPYTEIQDGDSRRVILSHYPMPIYRRSCNPNFYMLHGHVHQTRENDYVEGIKAYLRSVSDGTEGLHVRNLAQLYNVGCMMPWMNYTPRTLDEIIRRHAAYGRSERNGADLR